MGNFSSTVIMLVSALLTTGALSTHLQAADLAEAAQAAAAAAAEKAAMGMFPLKPYAGAKGFVSYAPDGDFYAPNGGRAKFIEYDLGWNAAVFGGVTAGDFVKLQLDTGYISNGVANLSGVEGGSGTVAAAYVMAGVVLSAPLTPLTKKVIPFAGISVGAAFPVIGTITGTIPNGDAFSIKGSQSTVGALLARAGVTIVITPKLGASLEYGFFQTADFSLNTTDNISSSGNASTDISAHLFGLGFEYHF
ncbi:outer membrane beta-barrel protein [Pseudovibrio sp. Tun.PSC04-5.I4]|uniref:outer membrane beta-barrel protein n=1 Tax=Pseudovibrio sp. Tun.PSC04-5.I4 TaxID=1798213 RepID=UPI0008870018|nr:outer membrane beta-barrel protein [Pseudovibrio sp. Tun.PSC04-5.I4]SDR19015.1 Outer membrane protein beta-barrel domain-containing protein [Pseudovibrio sp. Tun.PSC04-5.I4]